MLFGVIVIVFLILRLIPGDPAKILLFGSQVSSARIASVRAQLGLDQPLWTQFFSYLEQLLRGDFGYSYITHTSVGSEIASRLPDSLALALGGLVVAVAIGIPTGILAGLRPGGVVDRFATTFSVLGVAIPYFWLAQLLVLVFSVSLGWLPALGVQGFAALILPSVSLGVGFAAILTRILRSSLIEIYQQPFILVAKSHGLSDWQVLWKHAFRNAVASILTMLALQIGNLIAGAVAIEIIFGRIGIGYYLVHAIQQKDIPAVQGVVLLIAVVYVVLNIVVDILHGVIDPRVRKGWER